MLDEATRALDNETDRSVMEAIMRFGGRKTIIHIAHRLSTLKHCDRIFVFEDGHFIRSGNYQEIVEIIPAIKN